MSRKQGRKHKHKKAPSIVGKAATDGSPVRTDTDHCEETENKHIEEEEPNQLSRKWEWDLMTVLTAILAAGTIFTFAVLWIQLQDARGNFRSDQRPYIWFTSGTPLGQPQLLTSGTYAGYLGVAFTFTNYGKSPGIDVRTDSHIAIGPDAWQKVSLHEITQEHGSLVPTGNTMANFAYSDEMIGNEIFEQIKEGLPYIVFGHFEYTDMTQTPSVIYISEFCQIGTKATGIPSVDTASLEHGICIEHNGLRIKAQK